MKLVYFFILLSFICTSNAQDAVEKIDLEKMVKDQIEAARAKQTTVVSDTATLAVKKEQQGSVDETKEQTNTNSEEITEEKIDKAKILFDLSKAKKEFVEIAKTESKPVYEKRKPYVVKRIKKPVESSGVAWKFMLILFVSVAAAAVVIYRRRKTTQKESKDKVLKENIQLIREERLVKQSNPYLNEIRKRLKDGPGRIQLNDIIVTKTARDLKISKGEILLANRIHNHEKMNAV